MKASAISHTENFQIRTYEIDQKKVCTVPALINLMHEAAMQNVINIKVSVWDMEVHQISWVLMRMYLKINRLPILGENISIYTSPSGFEKFFTYRDYKVFAENGDLLAYTSSTWLLMDTVKRRMTRIPDFILSFTNQMPSKEDCLPRPSKAKMPEFEKTDFVKTNQITWFDLDFNKHLSNVHYIKWMLEALPNDVLKEKTMTDLRIEYRIEGQLDEMIQSEIQDLGEGRFLHRLVRDGKELARAETTWR